MLKCPALLAVLALVALSARAVEVPLTVTNRGKAERWELAGGGVPMPMGAEKDTEKFRVLDAAGKAVPAQFTVLCRWPSDMSIRWVLVQFPAKLAGGATGKFKLKTDGGTAAPDPKWKVKVTDGADAVTVDTGVLRFSAKKKGFALFDTVDVLDGGKATRVAGPGAAGAGVEIEADGRAKATMAACAESDVALEDVGPLRASVRARGVHKDEAGKTLFSYLVRMYAVAGSRAVRVQYTFTCDKARWPGEEIRVRRVSMLVKPAIGGNVQVSGTDPEGKRKLAPGSRLATSPISADGPAGVFDGPAALSAAGKGVGAAAAVRWFWQTRPKSMELSGGNLSVNVVDARTEKEPVYYYPGMAKTHDVLFRFSGPGESLDTEASLAGFQKPFFVKCPPEWYCQKTLSCGRLVSSDYTGYLRNLQAARKVIDDGFAAQIRTIRRLRAKVIDRKRGMNSYHVVHFGDGFHHLKKSGHTGVEWDNCYYSYTHILAMQYLRSGDDLFLDTLREATAYESDVSFVWHPASYGAPRVNPGAYHVGAFSGWGKRWASYTYNFYKPIGMLECFFLTGDRRLQEAGVANAEWMLTHNGYGMLNNPRSCGAGCRAAVHAYLATGNEDFLHVARMLALYAVNMHKTFTHFAPVQNSIFMAPNALEGLCVYHEITGDDELGKYIAEMVENHFKRFCKNPSSLVYGYMMFYAAAVKEDEPMRNQMIAGMGGLSRFGVRKGNHAVKDFSANRRGLPLMMWYMTDLAGKPTPWAGKIDLGPMPVREAECPRMDAPTIDGRADAREWASAAELKLIHDPNPRAKLDSPGVLRVGHDGSKLYVLVKVEEPLLKEIKTTITEENGPVFKDDCVELHISPVPRRVGLKLIVNSAGVRATRSRGFDRKKWKAPEPSAFPVKAGKWEKGWLLEITVPFDKLPLKGKPKVGEEIGFNCNRFRQVGNHESSTWFGTSNQVDSIGTLKLK
ncbi:MAG: exo-rhamnogalacturonan lyase family protein [Planctomycetota bacterium]|jgi:hypothetical protein